MTDPYELVIRFGRPFSGRAGDGVLRTIREVTVPFTGGREAAEAAQRDVQVFIRRARDAGGEDYHPLVDGTVVSDAVGTERFPGNGGYTEVSTAVVREGTLRVSSYFQGITDDGEVIGWQCLGREATLNGEIILEPLRAQALAEEAGLSVPPVRWVKDKETPG